MGTGDVADGVASGLGGAWSLGDIGMLGDLPSGSTCHVEQFDDAHHEGAPHDQAGLGDYAMESASMRDFMAELETTLPAMTEGESIVARQADDKDVRPQPQAVCLGERAPDTEEDRMAREAREDEEEAARTKALTDADPRTQTMARDMEAMRQLETGGAGVRGYAAEDEQMEAVRMGEPAPDTEENRMAREAREDEEEAARAKALADADPELVEEAAAHASHAVREREGETAGPDIDNAPIVSIPRDGVADTVAVAHDGEARGEIEINSTVQEADAVQPVAAQMVDCGDKTQLRDPREVYAGDVGDEEAVRSPVAVGGDVQTGEDAYEKVHGDVCAPSTIPASGVEEGAGIMAPPPVQEDAPMTTHHRRCRRPPGPRTQCARYVEQPRGSLMFDAMTVDELGVCLAMDLTETRHGVRIGSKKGITLLPRVQSVSWGPASPTPPSDASVVVGAMGVGATQSPPSVVRDRGRRPSAPTSAAGRPRERREATTRVVASLLGRTDVLWSNTRRSTTATRKRQPGLGRRRTSTSSTREVHAAGFEHRGGLGADVGDADERGFAAPGARVSTHGWREVSQILGADVLGPPRTQRPIPRRASHREGETTGGEGLEMT
ncbi:hypothetical protein CBR_g50257 [Chara braunii]|uniref:Uncharacterized protein n=1 Tax=Chara braunii TaxID=69332 RepID=A0A388M6Q7_CHABU|nr:hypothetical protein CBR_g50257 [Chara braunii]|eukprot:GBG90163.1 hypothetical protein CBR_g50257 [Chara braunii]